MEIKNLFEPAVKQDIVARIHKLTPQSRSRWGRMNVAQMLAHCQKPIEVALGIHKPEGNWILNTFGPLLKSFLYNGKPYRRGLPTDPSFIMTGSEKDFHNEKQKLLDLIQRLNETSLTDKKHPVFGRLTKEQWSKATWKHLDHHLRQFGV